MDRTSVWQVIKFTLFSASAGLIQVAGFTVIHECLHLAYLPAYLISLIASIVWNFTLNRRYTFRSAANVPIAMAKVFGYYLVFTPLSSYLGTLAEGAGANEYLVLAFTMIANFVTEFLFNKLVVYRNQENTR